jgi:hypothetical protein
MSTTFDLALGALASWLLLLCAAWAALLGLAALVEACTSGRVGALAWVGCPGPLRRALLAGLGVALATGSTPVHADDAASRGLPLPARPVGVHPDPQSRAAGPHILVTVSPGDSLWGIASARLGPAASPGAVAGLVRRLHDRNRRTIGPDADLVHPGQRLVLPPLPRSQHGHHLEERP